MKKQIAFSSLIVSILAFLFLIPHFNNEVDYNFTYMHNYIDNGQYVIMGQITENIAISDIDYRVFHKDLNESAIKNNLVVVQFLTTKDEDVRKEVMYLSTNDLYAKDIFMLEEGLVDINSNQNYSTTSNEKSTKIAGIYLTRDYELDSILNSHENAGGYTFANIQGDLDENFNNFIQDMDEIYPGIIIHNAKTFTESMSKNAVDGLFFVKVLCISFLMIIMAAKMFSMQKLVSLYKIEGYTNIKIYNQLFLKPFAVVNGILLIIVFICFSVYYQSPITLRLLFQLYLMQFGLLILIELVASLLFYLIINYVPKVTSIKGKNELNKIQLCAYILKVGIVVITIPILTNQFLPAIDFIKMNLRYNQVIKDLENYYSFGSIISSNYHTDRGSDNYISLSYDLAVNNNLFDLSKAGYFDFDNFDPNNVNYFYIADENYLEQVGLRGETFNKEECYIYNRPNTKFDLELLEADIVNNDPNPPKINYVDYDISLKSYDIRTLLFKDEIDNIPLVYMPIEKQFQGQLNSSVFYYDNDDVPVQDYIDYIFRMHGYTPGYRIDSMVSNYSAVFNGYVALSIQSFMQFLIAMFALITVVVFLFEVDLDNNRKQYRISYIEGVNVYSFTTYVLKFASASVVGLIIAMVMIPNIMNKQLISCVGFILIVEAFMYLLFMKRCRRR